MKKKAFTILEVLMVVLIIGILVALAMPSFEGAKIRAKMPRMLIDVRQIETARDLIIAEYGLSLDLAVDFGALDDFRDKGYDVPDNTGPDFYYGIGLGTQRWAIWVKTGGLNGQVLCANRIYFANGRKEWAIYTDHPWARYLSIPGAIQETS